MQKPDKFVVRSILLLTVALNVAFSRFSFAADAAPETSSARTSSRDAAGKMPPPTEAGHKTGLIPRELLFGNPDRAAARMSHDGKWLSWLAPVDGVLNIWVAP